MNEAHQLYLEGVALAQKYEALKDEMALLKKDAAVLADALLVLPMTVGQRYTNEGQQVVDAYLTAHKHKSPGKGS